MRTQIGVRVVIALAPLALVPVLVRGIADGWIDLGGGEKDLVWVLPWLLWSLVFAACSLVLGWRGWSVPGATGRAMLVASCAVVGAGFLLALLGQLGVAGRF